MSSFCVQILISIVFVSFTNLVNAETLRERLFGYNGGCSADEFRCQNDVCISRDKHCNGKNDCGDNSDEQFCNSNACPKDSSFIRCPRDYNYYKCIPALWKCDGIIDCFNGYDEKDCPDDTRALILRGKKLAQDWIMKQRNFDGSTHKWGAEVHRIAVSLYLANATTLRHDSFNRSELAYELSLGLLSRLALKEINDVPTTELASYVNAFLVTCIDPRKFYVVDLVSELRRRVDAKNYTNPFVMLALCNAEDRITDLDVTKLIDVFWKANREFWTDTQAFVIMALSCAAAQPHGVFDRTRLNSLSMVLKKRQYRNGTVENHKTTALVMQALFASQKEADEDNFDEEKAIKQIIRSQMKNGSFGSLVNTYYALPVLGYRSLVNISSSHCMTSVIDEEEGYRNLLNQVGIKWNIGYSLWIGDKPTIKRTLSLEVPANTSLYGLMEYASDIDDKFRFEYTMKNGKPYVYSISGIQDDPENDMFWFPYCEEEEFTPITESPADVIPEDTGHIVFWYKCGSWSQ